MLRWNRWKGEQTERPTRPRHRPNRFRRDLISRWRSLKDYPAATVKLAASLVVVAGYSAEFAQALFRAAEAAGFAVAGVAVVALALGVSSSSSPVLAEATPLAAWVLPIAPPAGPRGRP